MNLRFFFAFSVFAFFSGEAVFAQTNSVTSGNWSDGTVWSTSAVPAQAATVNSSHPITLDQNITITTGTYNFGYNGTASVAANVTDAPGGTAYTLTMTTSGGTLDIKAGTTTFEGAANLDNSTLIVRTGATLILGATTINNGTHLTVEAGGTLIINGNFTNNNNGTGSFSLAGAVQINGNYDAPVGSVDITGAGTFDATGTITTTGSSNVFGSTNDCTSGPCSGTTLTCTFTNTVSPTSQVLCSGSTAGTFTATTNGGTPTYLWESSITSASSGFASAAGTNNNATYASPSGLTQTTWYRVAITSGGCTSRSAAVKVSVLTGGGWKGTTSNWGTASNWCSGTLPTSTTDVTISPFPSGSGLFMPVIQSGTAANARNIVIDNGASITVNSGGSLSVFGNFSNNGSFTDNTAVASGVSFVGSAVQTISGTSANTFNNLTLNNSSGSVPAINVNSNNVTVNSNLTLTSGKINLNGFTITLGTAAATQGTLARSAGTLFYNGNITRWFPTTSITLATDASLFPIGTSTDYRPIYFANTGLTAGGTIKVSHTSVAGSSTAAFTDDLPIVKRSSSFWTVTTGNGLGTGTFDIRTEGTGFGTVASVTHLRLTYAAAKAAGSPGTNAGTTSNPQVNRTGINTASVSLANTYYWGSTNASTPLPIKLLYFTGHALESGINLSWATALEQNFDRFSLERSSDGKSFLSIATIRSTSGNTRQKTEYDFVDPYPLNGRNYYRLKNIDLDGHYDYSEVIEVVALENGAIMIQVFPNPVAMNRSIKIDYKRSGSGSLSVLDGVGRVMLTTTLVTGEQELSIPATMPPGIYYLKVQSDSGLQVVKLAVQQ